MNKLQKQLLDLADKEYAVLQTKLTPTIDPKTCIGVRVPVLRKFAKEFYQDKESISFMKSLPHKYYDENMLHGMLIDQIKDVNDCLYEINRFLPYVDNWAVCDTIKLRLFKKHKDILLKEIKKWIKSKETYTIRFGIEMLMTYYLDDDFKVEYLDMVSKIRSNEYYVNMMIAWFFATALAKQYNSTISYIEQHRLAEWTNNKTIQKCVESYRITNKQKQYLRTLKV